MMMPKNTSFFGISAVVRIYDHINAIILMYVLCCNPKKDALV